MKIFEKKDGKFKFCNLTIFKFKKTKKCMRFYLLGIPLFRYGKEISRIINKVEENKNFDMSEIDNEIALFVSNGTPKKIKLNSKRIAYIATELYDMGGHSKCIGRLVKSLDGIYEQKLFLTKKTKELAIISFLKKYLDILDYDYNLFKLKQQSKLIANAIIEYAPKALFVYIHPKDIIGAGVISLIKKTTNIKIIFSNHASHFPNLAMSFADIILEGMTTTVKVTNEKRHLYNTRITSLQSLCKNETIYFSKNEISNLRKEMGIKINSLVTMSGGGPYKFFKSNNTSEYFEMIKRLLHKEKKLYHIVISQLNSKQKEIVDNIFKDSKEERKRLIFIPFQTEFDKYFQCADVFIDSFPISSALTQIDLMRNKVASVVKINKENSAYSFHEYQMPNYPYMFENIDDMENGIYELLHNKDKRKEIIEKNYDFWLKKYESNIKRDEIIKILEEF